MYLLMLLATFISAIYGFNLSARPDYDRDVPRKKAMGVVYKFLYQEKSAFSLLSRVSGGMYKDTSYALAWIEPGDIIFADFRSSDVDTHNRDTTLFYKQTIVDGSTAQPFFLRKKSPHSSEEVVDGKYALSADYLEAGRRFFNGTEMVTKLLCLDKEMYKANAASCVPTPKMDPTGEEVIGVTDTCCGKFKYIVSYKKLDARWVNRLHKGISLDFMNAIVDRDYTDNIGVIHWDPEKEVTGNIGDANGEKGRWVFQGKINFTPVYAEEMEKWENEHINEDGTKQFYPGDLRDRANWTLPIAVFPENFFKDKDGKNICELGCLFKIRAF